MIVEGPTWEEAEANAVALGGHLVTINDAEENEFIVDMMNYHGLRESGEQPFIGFTDKEVEGAWAWSSGEEVTYTNWDAGQPDDDSGYGAQDYAFVRPTSNSGHVGTWVDTWSDSSNKRTGIAEIPLAPNNTPTGTPTLTGDFKVGQTISIDSLAIEDADNFEGWTPTYEYLWNVSSDNGTTWIAATSADATDGDESYTLTSAEVGKQLRGVVSYLDGYGTTETVLSVPSESIVTENLPLDAQLLSLTKPGLITIRSGFDTSTTIAYNVDESNKQLTGVSASLYFDSTHVTIDFADDPYPSSLLGYGITADSSDGDNDPATDSVVALSYTDFLGNFPGSSVSLPLTLADLTITPTENYTGTTLNLKGTGAIGYDVIGDTLTLGYDAAPVVAQPIGDLSVDALSPWSYTLPTNLFFDPDSDLTLSIDSDLPSWVSYDPDTTTFSGTPSSSADSFEVVLSSADDLGSVTTSFDLNVRDVQIIHPESNTVDYQGGQSLALPLFFSATDGESSTGLAFHLHYDSSLFSFSSIDNPISGMTSDYDTSADIADADNDPETDTVLNVTIASFDGSLASGSQLGIFNFEVADLPPADPDDPDPITGLRPSVMNLTASSTATGYGFAADPITLEPVLFNLDVDGDGAVTALGDGLMVIRKLFGAAFAGDALTNKAISPYATRTTQEIHDYIQSGIDGGYLDIDLDDDTTALGDGLMVIRRLFGPAFAGDALISKAINPESSYYGQENAWELVAANIDALIP